MKKDRLYIGIFIVVIMVSSTLGFVLNFSTSRSIKYKKFVFHQEDSGYSTKYKSVKLNIITNPLALEDVDASFTKDFSGREIVITFNPSGDLSIIDNSRYRLERFFSDFYRIKTIAAVSNITKDYALPVINCNKELNQTQDSQNNRLIIFLQNINKTGISQKGNCITISGKDYNLNQAVDKFILDALS